MVFYQFALHSLSEGFLTETCHVSKASTSVTTTAAHFTDIPSRKRTEQNIIPYLFLVQLHTYTFRCTSTIHIKRSALAEAQICAWLLSFSPHLFLKHHSSCLYSLFATALRAEMTPYYDGLKGILRKSEDDD